MSIKEWIDIDLDIDIDNLNLLKVSEIEKKRVKSHVLKKHKKTSTWKKIAVIAALIMGITTVTGFAFPNIAAQIPIVSNVMNYIRDDFNRFAKFEQFSNDVGLVQSSNGITVTIDKAVYDGRNITVSYSFETEISDFGNNVKPSRSGDWFRVNGASLNIGGSTTKKISDTQHIGVINYIPLFPDGLFPETVEVTMNPSYFYSEEHNFVVNGDWLFEFSLTRLDSEIKLVDKTTTHPEVSVTIKTLEFTNVSTIMNYEQLITPELQKSFGTVFPIFHISDNLGQVYMDGIDQWGGGITVNSEELLHKGTLTFGAINKEATQLIIKPMSAERPGFIKNRIELEPIVIDLID